MWRAVTATHAEATIPIVLPYKRLPRKKISAIVPRSNRPEIARANMIVPASESFAQGPVIADGGANRAERESRYIGKEPYAKKCGLRGLDEEKNWKKSFGNDRLEATRRI